jgi:hypothetical protein
MRNVALENSSDLNDKNVNLYRKIMNFFKKIARIFYKGIMDLKKV